MEPGQSSGISSKSKESRTHSRHFTRKGRGEAGRDCFSCKKSKKRCDWPDTKEEQLLPLPSACFGQPTDAAQTTTAPPEAYWSNLARTQDDHGTAIHYGSSSLDGVTYYSNPHPHPITYGDGTGYPGQDEYLSMCPSNAPTHINQSAHNPVDLQSTTNWPQTYPAFDWQSHTAPADLEAHARTLAELADEVELVQDTQTAGAYEPGPQMRQMPESTVNPQAPWHLDARLRTSVPARDYVPMESAELGYGTSSELYQWMPSSNPGTLSPLDQNLDCSFNASQPNFPNLGFDPDSEVRGAQAGDNNIGYQRD
ncbi:hypothetical protein IAT40_000632 [Kwoniella sp. CBS 6097]